MEDELVQSLQDVGYDGSLIELEKLQQALEQGVKSVDFKHLVSWLAEQIVLFGNIDEQRYSITSGEDNNVFFLELSSFLDELGCMNSQLISGPVNQRLATKQERILLLDYLIVELKACKIIQVKKPDTPKLALTINESDTAKCLKDMLIALQISKPPDNISSKQLFDKLHNKLNTAVASASSDLLGKPLVIGELSPAQWNKLDQLQNDMMEEYQIRREMLLKRLDVTIQSFLWSDKIKAKQDQLNNIYHSKRDILYPTPNVTIAQLLASRDDISIIEKTSNATVRKNTRSEVTKVIIGNVPDRGGRAYEQAPPPKEIPSWKKNLSQNQPTTSWKKDVKSNFTRENNDNRRNWHSNDSDRGGYQNRKQANSNFGQNQDYYDNPQSSGSFTSTGNFRGDNRRGGNRGGGRNNRRRGGRVQSGWA